PPPFGTRIRVECLLGMGRAGKKFVLLLDIDRLLSTDDVTAAQTAVDTTEPAAIVEESLPGEAASSAALGS
ncbi:MAG TPA: chemotaxis protein CheW, partial [Vicinamibacteria bacterium]